MSEYRYQNDYERENTEKFVGVYTHEEIELNKRLYDECIKRPIDFTLVEELLKQGADPLGATAEYGWGLLEHVYGEIVGPTGYADEEVSADYPRITELFLKYGMDISSPRIPYDGHNSLNPLFCFPIDKNSIKALKILLDAGLDAESACEFWETEIFDQFNVCNYDPNEYHDYFTMMMKMVMLVGSYDHILCEDEGLYEILGCSYNSYDIKRFRNWDNYYYVFDTSRCVNHPELYKSVVRIYEVDTDIEVWKIGFRLPEGTF